MLKSFTENLFPVTRETLLFDSKRCALLTRGQKSLPQRFPLIRESTAWFCHFSQSINYEYEKSSVSLFYSARSSSARLVIKHTAIQNILNPTRTITTQRMKFSVRNPLVINCEEIHKNCDFFSHLLKKFLSVKLHFCTVYPNPPPKLPEHTQSHLKYIDDILV